MDVVTLRKLAHPAEHYNTLDDLINALVQPLLVDHTPWSAYRTVRDVLTGLCRADLNGLISAGDEHEWAAAALRANELALQAAQTDPPVGSCAACGEGTEGNHINGGCVR